MPRIKSRRKCFDKGGDTMSEAKRMSEKRLDNIKMWADAGMTSGQELLWQDECEGMCGV